MAATYPMEAPTQVTPIRVERSVLDRAKANDVEAIASMFQQFVSHDEEIYFAEYCGVEGFWGFGTHCFACLTNRRLSALKIGFFGLVVYQDGYLEHANSGVVYQPSKFWLYVWGILSALFAILLAISSFQFAAEIVSGFDGALGLIGAVIVVALGLALSCLVFLLAIKSYYRFVKCGLVWWIREGISVYIFTNRSKLSRANHLYRLCTQARDERIKLMGQP